MKIKNTSVLNLNNIRLNQLEFQRLLQQLTVSKDLNGLGLKYENNKTLDINCESITQRVIINDIDNIKKSFDMANFKPSLRSRETVVTLSMEFLNSSNLICNILSLSLGITLL